MSYTPGMKTAVSIPDDVFGDAERLAAELKTSRSQLYARALREYLARHSAEAVTAALDSMYGDQSADAADPDLDFMLAASDQTLSRDEW